MVGMMAMTQVPLPSGRFASCLNKQGSVIARDDEEGRRRGLTMESTPKLEPDFDSKNSIGFVEVGDFDDDN